jgi:hypothetical protein
MAAAEPIESVRLGHIEAWRVLEPTGRPRIAFHREKGRVGAGKGVPRLGRAWEPEDLRRFAVRLLVWAEEIEAWRETKRKR